MADKFQRSMKWPGLDDTYYFLPLVSEADNGKVMTVENGDWAVGGQQVSFDTTGSGNTIVIDDAAHRPLRGLQVFGKTTQVTTTGKNLFDPSQVNTLGFSDSTSITSLSNCRGYYMPIVAGTTYTVSRRNTSDFNRFRLGFTVDVPAASRKLIDASINRDTTKVITAQAPANANYLILYFSNESQTITGEMVQIEVGAAATEWEPYTGGIPSPNPDYPQPLVSVGDDGGVKVGCIGKNLFNGGDLSFKAMVRVQLEYPLPPGTYNIGAVVESEATDSQNSRIIFLDADGKDSGSAQFTRGARSVVSRTLNKTIYAITFWAGNNITTSSGKTCTWKDIMISRDGESTDYEPYKGQTITLSTPNGLPGIPVPSGGNYTDANGQQWICDEVDLERGKYVQRVKMVVFDGSSDESWKQRSTSAGGTRQYTTIDAVFVESGNTTIARVLCDRFTAVSADSTWRAVTGLSLTARENNLPLLDIYHPDFAAASVTDWTGWLAANPVTCVFILETPIETSLSAEEIAAYKALTTHYPTTTIYNDESAEMEVEYVNKNNFDADAVLFRKQTLTDAQKAQILDNIGASSRLQVHDVSVTTSLWVDSTLHADYPYQALIPVNGATSEMCPDVVFDVTEALSGNYAPVADAANGGVLIYAKVVPEADIVVPTVTLWK